MYLYTDILRGRRQGIKTETEKTELGSIGLEGEKNSKDFLDRCRNARRNFASNYLTGHGLSLTEAECIIEQGADHIIYGTSQDNPTGLSEEICGFFKDKEIKVKLLVTPKAIPDWNEAKGAPLGYFHSA